MGNAKPILKWVGSKRAIVPALLDHMPAEYNDYWEPFVGGGSLFLALFPDKEHKAHLSDLNDDLITTYKAVRSCRGALMRQLDELNRDWSEEAYYRIRSQHNLTGTVERAARFLYLNKYCYNGLSRYNSKGEFNVPWGHKKNQVALYDEGNLKEVASALRGTDLRTMPYQDIKPKPGDFVYFDPPYHSTFSNYQKGGFDEEAQRELAQFCRRLHEQGVLFMASNSATDFIEELYAGFAIDHVDAPRYVSCRSDGRKPVTEVLVTNYGDKRRADKSGGSC